MDFGLRLSRFLKARNISIAALARKCELSRSTINRVINNEVSPSIVQINQIANALGIAAVDVVNRNRVPESFALTGYTIIDTLIINAGRLRSMKQGPAMDALYAQTHTTDSKCYSRWYNTLLDFRIDKSASPPCDVRLKGKSEYFLQCPLYEHHQIPHLYGIDVKSELFLNSQNVKDDNVFIYYPMTAQFTGHQRVQVLTLFYSQGLGPQYSIDEYQLTASIQSILHGKAKPLIKTKLWSQVPTESGYRMSEEAMMAYINHK